jgi:hypothetical protein
MSNIPLGICQCGCGEQTRIAPVNDKSKGWTKGVPVSYVKGHSAKSLSKSGSDSHNWKGGRTNSSHGYVVVTDESGEKIYEHILVAQRILGRVLRFFGVGDGNNEVVHHIDGDKKNNAPKNLLICTHAYHVALHARLELSEAWPEFLKRLKHPNGTSRVGESGYKGVRFCKKLGRWRAIISVDGKAKRLGAFDFPELAAKAYDDAAVTIFGANWITNKSLGLL